MPGGNTGELHSTKVKREVQSSSPWYPGIGRMGMVQSCARGGSDWTLESISLPGGWSNSGAVFPERWTMPQACQC